MANNEYLAVNVECPDCNASRALSVYANNSTHCFKCGRARNNLTDNEVEKLCTSNQTKSKNRKGYRMPTSPEEFTYAKEAVYQNLLDRGISKKTCEVYGVKSMRDPDTGKYIHLYPYFNDKKELKAQKVRNFRVEKKDPMHMKVDRVDDTEFSDVMPFGSQAFELSRFKHVTVCEGETDAMAAYGLLGSKWPVLSINGGAGSAKRELSKWGHLLDKCDTIVLCFDSDKAGKEAALACQALFYTNDCKIMTVPRGLKDACDVLKVYQTDKTIMAEFQKNWWASKEVQLEGVLDGKQAFELMKNKVRTESLPSPWKGLDKKTGGNRTGELWTWTAGSGQGKSQIIREVIHNFYKKTDWRMGIMMMEEGIDKTCSTLAGIEVSLPLYNLSNEGPKEQKDKYWQQSLDISEEMFYKSGRFAFKDKFGSSNIKEIARCVEYMVVRKNCKVIVLDHLSMIVSSQENGDERKAIDEVMTKLATIASKYKIQIHLISHLKRPAGKGHEDGATTSLAELRGSASIAQLSDMVIGLERNQQAKDDYLRNTTILRVLKNRFSGQTGEACYLHYDENTSRMSEIESEVFEMALESEAELQKKSKGSSSDKALNAFN